METLLVEVKNDKALKLLEDLVELDLIKILHKKVEPKTKEDLIKYFGVLTEKEGTDLLNYVNESRIGWEKDI